MMMMMMMMMIGRSYRELGQFTVGNSLSFSSDEMRSGI